MHKEIGSFWFLCSKCLCLFITMLFVYITKYIACLTSHMCKCYFTIIVLVSVLKFYWSGPLNESRTKEQIEIIDWNRSFLYKKITYVQRTFINVAKNKCINVLLLFSCACSQNQINQPRKAILQLSFCAA